MRRCVIVLRNILHIMGHEYQSVLCATMCDGVQPPQRPG